MSIELSIKKYSKIFHVESALINAIIEQESQYKPYVTGDAGEVGLMQVMPSTAKAFGWNPETEDLYNVDTNIKYGVKYIAFLERNFTNVMDVISAYNAGAYQNRKTLSVIHPYKNRAYVMRVYGKYISLMAINFINKAAPFVFGGLILLGLTGKRARDK